MQFDDMVMIEQNRVMAFNQSHFWIWDLDEGYVEQITRVNGNLQLEPAPVFMWVPYANDANLSEEHFELDYGKVCITTRVSLCTLYKELSLKINAPLSTVG